MQHDNDNAEGKVCTKCGEWKVLGEFTKDVRSSDGRKNSCKHCVAEYERMRLQDPEKRQKKREKDREYSSTNKEQKRLSDKIYYENNKDDIAKKQKGYYQANKQAHAERNRAWREKNPDRKREKDSEYRSRPDIRKRDRDRRKGNPRYILSMFMRSCIARCLQLKNKRTESLSSILGYSRKALIDRIECQFKSGMSWANHGEWHIDHKKPIAAFIAQGVTDPRQINMLCNLQPLWASENFSKCATWPLAAANDNQKRDKDAA